MLEKKADKLEPRSELRLFIGYPKGTKGGMFYSPDDQRIVVSTHFKFLEEDYIANHRPMSEVTLDELRGENQTSIPITLDSIPQFTEQQSVEPVSTQTEPRHSGRVLRQPDRWIDVGESMDLVLGQDEPDPCNYNEAIHDKNASS